MLIITSPAKRMDYESKWESKIITKPLFLKYSSQIASVLKKMDQKKLQKIMQISESIAELNYYRFRFWQKKHDTIGSRPAILTYNGDIFREMTPKTYTLSQQKHAQESVRIISGLYGLVRPYDLIQPYRLEMNVKVSVGKSKDLYTFWSDILTDYINEEIRQAKHKLLLNLASEEYYKAIDMTKIKGAKVLEVLFLKKKNGVDENVGILAKKARGMMIEWIIKNDIREEKDLVRFNTKGYKLKSKTSEKLVFVN